MNSSTLNQKPQIGLFLAKALMSLGDGNFSWELGEVVKFFNDVLFGCWKKT